MKLRLLIIFGILIAGIPGPLAAQSLSPQDLENLQALNAEDENSTLDLVHRGPRNLQVLKTADLGSKFITLPDKSRISLKTAWEDVRNLQSGFNTEIQNTLSKNPKALMNKKALSLILETPDSYVLVEGHSVEVEDPEAFKNSSEEFRSFMQKRQGKKPNFQKLPAEDQEKVRKYFEKLRAKASPIAGMGGKTLTTLKAGAAQDAALYEAMMQGEGVFEIAETVTLPKISPVQPPQETEISEQKPDPQDPAPELPATVIRASGKKNFEKTYMAGFTYNLASRWEKRWRFPGGLFRMTFAAGLTAGLRLPFQVSVSAEPTKIEVIKSQDIPFPVKAAVKVQPLDASPQVFRSLGIRDAVRSSEGMEFALAGNIQLGYKFYLFGENWLHRELSPIVDMNFGFDFTPPLDQEWSKRFPIPMTTTRTGIDKTWASGGLELGVKLSATGTVKLDGRWRTPGMTSNFRTLTFGDSKEQTLEAVLPRLGKPDTPMGTTLTQKYFLDFEKPRYTLTGYLTPCARIVAGIDLKLFSGSFETRWRDLNDFRVPLGSVTLSRHPGTPDRQTEEIGVKAFTKENTRTPSVAGKSFLTVKTSSGLKDVTFNTRASEAQRALILEDSDRNKQYFHVKYTDPRMASYPDDRKRFIVLQSDAQGNHIRAGIGGNSAIGVNGVTAEPRDGWNPNTDWEVFQILQTDDGYHLMSYGGTPSYVRYVDGQFRADTQRVGEATVFRFNRMKQPGDLD